MKINKTRITLTLVAALALTTPLLAQPGSADLSRYVALGDSLTAGFTNGSLVMSHQQWSYPQVISRAAGFGDIEQPLISEPGIPPELQLFSLQPLIIAPKAPADQNGQPINLMLPRPYDNLGIPGARANDLLVQRGDGQNANPFYQIVLRGQGSAVEQTIFLNPTFVSVWIGSNDVLAAVTSGSTAAMTPVDSFAESYQTIIGALRTQLPGAGMVTATIGPVTAIPFATTLPPVLADPVSGQIVPGPDGGPIFFIAELGDGSVGQLSPGSLVTLNAQPFLATGYGLPPQLAPLFPNLPDVGKPLPGAVVLDTAEVQAITVRTEELNDVIRQTSAAAGIPVVEVGEAFQEYLEGVEVAGVTLDTSFLLGGIFSFDGVHPTDIGYTLIANEFIEVINEAYGSNIPYASIVPFFANNAPPEASGYPDTSVASLLASPWSYHLDMSFTSIEVEEEQEEEETTTPRRRRGSGR